MNVARIHENILLAHTDSFQSTKLPTGQQDDGFYVVGYYK